VSGAPAAEAVRAFYDARLERMVADFVDGNRRVERAWETVDRFAPRDPRRLLELGCGIGGTAWRMSRRWPGSDVVGLDVSPQLLQAAQSLFASGTLSFVEGPLRPGLLQGHFDLIVLMDVYEHIAPAERQPLHEALAQLIGDGGRLVVTTPTPAHLAWLRANTPDEIQPVDEDVTVELLQALAAATSTELCLYQEVGIWYERDYLHAVFCRSDGFGVPVASAPQGRSRRRTWRRGGIAGDDSDRGRAALVRERLGAAPGGQTQR
jgi:trans-aconitate methyltransferase